MAIHFWRGTWHGKEPAGDSHTRSRQVVRPTGGIIRGKFPSRKNGRIVQYESLLELHAIYLFEANPLIARYREQLPKIAYPDGTRIRHYTPDFELALCTGEVVNVEVKPREKLDDPNIRHKFDRISAFYSREGLTFVVLHEDVIRKEPRQKNLQWVYHRARRIAPTNQAAQSAVRRFSAAFPTTFRQAAAQLAERDVCVYSLVLGGYLRCPLDEAVSYDTFLNISLESDHAWFYIAEEYEF